MKIFKKLYIPVDSLIYADRPYVSLHVLKYPFALRRCGSKRASPFQKGGCSNFRYNAAARPGYVLSGPPCGSCY